MASRPDDPSPAANDDFDRVEAVFAQVSALTSEMRAQVLGATLNDRPDLRDDVEALLAAHDAMAAVATAEDAAPPSLAPGGSLGPYRLVEKIGQGGMGEVFKAERNDGAFVRHVAIKVMRPTGSDTELLRRFKSERQILASLRHPNIVTLLDGGPTAAGPTYLVMELVAGADIMRHCRDAELSLRARLQLFRTLCVAVQYAHQHGVVHRDLKPANILIEPDGTLKVLDFGVAKLLQRAPDSGETTHGVLPGPLTPNYASPEQLRGLPVTTASDVYSLGIILYELVTDARPYETQGVTLDRVIELVVRTEPARPSAVASHRHLRGDIDAIVMKAISKDPLQRYDSAGEMGSDIARCLANEPVSARAPSAGYVLRRLAARHKTAVAISGLAIVAVLTATGVALWQWQVARREEARAEQRFREVRQLANAMIFKIHDAVAPLAGSTPVRRTIVDESLVYLERLAAEARADDGTLRLELAAAYRQIAAILGDPQRPNLGDRDGAIAQYERARELAVSVTSATRDFDVVSGIVEADVALATLYSLKQQKERATATAREAVDVATRYATDNPADERASAQVARSNFQLAWSLPTTEAVPVWEQTLASYEGELKTSPSAKAQRNVALVSKYLASSLQSIGRYDLATPHYARAVALDEARLKLNPNDRGVQFDAAISLNGMGALAEDRGDSDEAARYFDRSLAIRRQLAESDPKDVQAQERLGYALYRSGRSNRKGGQLKVALAYATEAVQLLKRLLGRTGDESTLAILAVATLELAITETAMHHRAEGCQAFREARRLYEKSSRKLDADISGLAIAVREAAACP